MQKSIPLIAILALACSPTEPLPFHDPDRLVVIHEMDAGGSVLGVDLAMTLAWRGEADVFQSVSVHRITELELTGDDGSRRLRAALISTDWFETLGLLPLLGRTFIPEEERSERSAVTLLSHELWQDQFAGRPDVVGTAIAFGGRSFTVVGVMPPRPPYPAEPVDLWVPLGSHHEHGDHALAVTARLKPDITLEQAAKRLKVLASGLAREDPDTYCGHEVRVVALLEQLR